MNKIKLLVLVGVFCLNHSYAQKLSNFHDIEILWNCEPQLSQENGSTRYYTCNYEDENGSYIFSLSTIDISKDVSQIGGFKSNYVTTYLERLKKGVIESGGVILSEDDIVEVSSLQYSIVTEVESQLKIKACTAAFILGNYSYMINLIGDYDNPKLEKEFLELVSYIKLK